MGKYLKCALSVVAIATGGAAMASNPSADRYAEGQVWEYRARPGDEGSVLKIGKIEQLSGPSQTQLVYHISIAGLDLGPRLAEGPIQHAPVSKETLDTSVTRLTESGADFGHVEEGIAEWRRAEGGVFTIPVADIVGLMVETVASGSRQSNQHD